MLLQTVSLTTARRPVLLPDEALLFVQDAVGLYDGNAKMPNRQRGQAYLTSHRVCYVDDAQPQTQSLAVDLREVERADYQAGFLRSSPKVAMHTRAKRHYTAPIAPSTGRAPGGGIGGGTTGSWVCPICSFANEIPPGLDVVAAAATAAPMPPCRACGIRPGLTTVLEAAVAGQARGRPPEEGGGNGINTDDNGSRETCWRCTFANDAALIECEMCGARLRRRENTSSPPPLEASLIKLSFRGGGERVFYDRLRDALVQRRWMLSHAPPVPSPSSPSQSTTPAPGLTTSTAPASPSVTGGIAGLERRGLARRQNNQAVLGNAFEDLEALMASARQVIALADTLAAEAGQSDKAAATAAAAAAASMGTTKQAAPSSSVYITELSRSLAEFLTDDSHAAASSATAGTGLLQRSGGIVTLVDVWAAFNRARDGVELASPADVRAAAETWVPLGLPVRLRAFRSGLLAVVAAGRSEVEVLARLRRWLEGEDDGDGNGDRGATAAEAAERFGWSVGVAAEELAAAEAAGVVCRDETAEVRFWPNRLVEEKEEEKQRGD